MVAFMKKHKIKIRKAWRINPRTRVKESEKAYSRDKMKRYARRLIREETDEA